MALKHIIMIGTATLAIGAAATPSFATSSVVAITTYLRTGPGVRYPPVEQVLANATIDLAGCKDDWCAVASHTGTFYIRQSALSKASSTARAADNCFDNPLAGYHGSQGTVFCTVAPR